MIGRVGAGADHGPRLNRYWNQRLDPLDWKRVREPAGRREWERAFATFLAPDTRDAIELLGDLRGKRLLDLGCGTGQGSLHLARRGADVVGVDVSDRRAGVARGSVERPQPGRTSFCAAQAERLPFADRSFDLIFARDVLMYADPRAAAGECRRVLVPGGRAVFVEALGGNPLFRLFRRATSPAEYRSLTHHLRWQEMASVGRPLVLVSVRGYYVLSVLAFACLFVLGSVSLYTRLLAWLAPLDRWLLGRFPFLARGAWRASALYRS